MKEKRGWIRGDLCGGGGGGGGLAVGGAGGLHGGWGAGGRGMGALCEVGSMRGPWDMRGP